MKKILEKIKTLDLGTIFRSLLFILVYINQIVALIGFNSFANSLVYQIITLACTLGISITCAIKNNNFTHLSQLAGKLVNALKDGKLNEEEINDLLNKAKENIE